MYMNSRTKRSLKVLESQPTNFFFFNHIKNKIINGQKFGQIHGIIYGEEKKIKMSCSSHIIQFDLYNL